MIKKEIATILLNMLALQIASKMLGALVFFP